MKLDHINPEIRDLIEGELLAEEVLLWVGQPATRRMIMNPGQARSPMIISMLLAMGLAVFIGMAVLVGTGGGGTAVPFMVFSLILLIALATVIAPFLSGFLTARRTIYAVTDRRVLIVSGQSVKSYGENDIEFVERTMQRGNTGDLIFRHEQRAVPVFYGNGLYSRREVAIPVGFFGIENVREIEALLLETFRAAADYAKLKHDDYDEPESVYLDAADEALTEDGRR